MAASFAAIRRAIKAFLIVKVSLVMRVTPLSKSTDAVEHDPLRHEKRPLSGHSNLSPERPEVMKLR
jgi:hypothetical protein